MTAKEFLIEWMEIKQELNPEIPFFIYKDADDIKTWDDTVAEVIVSMLIDNINKGGWVYILSPDLCPWCLYDGNYFKNKCDQCVYGKNHGICTDFKSDYDKIHRHHFGMGKIRQKLRELAKKYRGMVK